ncbi:hypothetical protein [Methylobacterium sp. WSM2598]|uniref:hypothetical protein n=1 Tax=Methylobacterium sp. WSM2598 TaxID=398261 RepID=UPI00035D5E40|nr:hypothetical protein [Methylobacterium sp. WSM2598]
MAPYAPPVSTTIMIDRMPAPSAAPGGLRRAGPRPGAGEGARSPAPAPSFSGILPGLAQTVRAAAEAARRRRSDEERQLRPIPVAPSPAAITIAPRRGLTDVLGGFSLAQLHEVAVEHLVRARDALLHAELLASGLYEDRSTRRDPEADRTTPQCFAVQLAQARVTLAMAESTEALLRQCIGRESALAAVLNGEGA